MPALLASAACPTELPPAVTDAGPVVGADAGTPPGQDAGTGIVDGGSPTDAGTPYDGGFVSDTVTLQGAIKERHYVSPRPAEGAKAVISGADCNQDGVIGPADRAACTITPNADGSYSLAGLAPGSVLLASMDRPGETCAFEQGAACNTGHFSTVATVKTGTDSIQSTDLYSVKYQWLIEQAVRCGVVPTLADTALDFVSYSSILGTLREASGTPKAGVPADSIAVQVDAYPNTGLKVCFLENYAGDTPDDQTDDVYRVALDANNAPVTQSTSNGMFLIFKTRNATGTGSGQHTVAVTDFGSARIPLNAGKLGVVSVYEGSDAPVVQQLIDFTREIMPIFTRNGCVACHRPGGSGAVPLPGGEYPMDFTGDPQAVYEAIRAPSLTNPFRISFERPEDSLMVTMPLYEDPPNHPNASFESLDDPDARLLIDWIGQGAQSGFLPMPDPTPTLTELIDISPDIGCTSCHAAERGADFSAGTPGRPYGGIPLDGCIPFYDYPAEYAPTDNAVRMDQRPREENQRCVYWHLTKQRVYNDPYYADQPDNDGDGTAGEEEDARRVNTSEPDKSQFIRNPYCGPDQDGNLVGDGCEGVEPQYGETHPYRVWFSQDDAPYVMFRTWVAAGANNDGEYGDASP